MRYEREKKIQLRIMVHPGRKESLRVWFLESSGSMLAVVVAGIAIKILVEGFHCFLKAFLQVFKNHDKNLKFVIKCIIKFFKLCS